MQYNVTRQDKGKVEVKVDIPQDIFDQTYGQVLGEFKKETKVAGFRPGMAPNDIVEGQVGYNKILNEAASFLVSKHLSEILKKEELVPLNNPQIAMDSLAKGSALSFTATFTQRPGVKLEDWRRIKVERIKAKEIMDEDITKSIMNIYEAWKKQQEVSKVSNVSEAEDSSDEGSQKYIYDARGNKLPVGSLRSSSNQDSTAGLKIPNKAEIYMVDDEFAKKIGARDLGHLKELVKKDLETLVADQVEQDFEQKLFDEMVKIVDVEVPEVLIDDELNRILLRLGSELERQGKTLEDFLKEETTTIDALKAKWRDQAEKNVKISMAMDEIGKEQKVQVTKEELEAALAGVNQTSLSADQKKDLDNYLVVSIFQAKTLDLVKKAVATVVDG